MKYDVFLSYSRKDSAKADAVCEALSGARISFFIDKEGISAGENCPEVLASTIDESRVFLLMASRNSYQSKFTKAELLYAFNHMRSGCIIPYILDDTPMPQDLEFLLGNVNWVYESKCPVSQLPDKIRHILDSPETGTIGGRKVRSKWPLRVVLGLVAVALFALTATMFSQRSSKSAALADYQNYERYICRADSLIDSAALLGSLPNTLETTCDQIAALKGALAEVQKADSIKAIHASDEHIALFSTNTESLVRCAESRLDSMHTAWSNYARESYSLYKATRSASERQNVLDCIGHALSIKPNPSLESLKQTISAK